MSIERKNISLRIADVLGKNKEDLLSESAGIRLEDRTKIVASIVDPYHRIIQNLLAELSLHLVMNNENDTKRLLAENFSKRVVKSIIYGEEE